MSVLVEEADFEELAYSYMKKMQEDKVCHVEPFFDPQGHTCRGVSFRTVYDGLKRGFDKGEKEFGITVGLIFSFLRHLSEEECLQFVQQDTPDGQYMRELFAKKAFVAVGLDSSELGNPPEKFVRLFQYCRETLQVPFLVAHAGEEGPPEYIRGAIGELRIHRIDHGVASLKDEALLTELAQSQMPLTVCPLSNYKLKVFPEAAECRQAVCALLRKGLKVTLNSDDPTYFGGYLKANFLFVAEDPSVTREEIMTMARNSIEASFISDTLKQKYLQLLEKEAKSA
ncbi:adenosine deaminase [Angomonas deanei]|uniref:Adenosine/AMP deaminase, putative n=1 Tax=Angomonas deanei TaxID=59799 RepID=A0A7G2CAL4_9TRYP|nr:adenosine deaminase [Angomonas deanei]CAD2216826.1 Adenosine/AMP deaminase, putative [Angomonas deanei]|eukprot:EPY17937.1 adenosine deaminase [Angomonas deanei]